MPPKQQPKKKSNKPRVKNAKPTLSAARRTPNSIITTLHQPTRRPTGHSKYVLCRAFPFAAPGGDGHPDGGNSNYVVSDSFAVCNFSASASGQTVVLQTLPSLPFMGILKSSQSLTVDTNAVTGGTVGLDGTLLGSWTPVLSPNVFTGSITPGTAYTDPWQSTGIRFVTLGYRIVYTGPATTCAGSITVTPNSPTVELFGTTSAAGVTVKAVTNTLVDNGAYPNNTPLLLMECVINPSAMTRSSRTYRPEQGVTLIPQHRTTNFSIQPTPLTPCALIANKNVAVNESIYSAVINVAPARREGVICFDNAWSGYQVVFNNLNADASYRIEAVICLEFNPAVGTPFFNTSKDKSPNNPADLKAGDEAASKTPIAPSTR
jgi:hypothetical protein